MICKICHLNETDSTNGICWKCLSKNLILYPNLFRTNVEEQNIEGYYNSLIPNMYRTDV